MVTQAAGYRGKVTVYNAAYDPVMSVNLTSAFVLDAALSDDGRTLATLTVGYRELPPASYTTAREPLEFTTGFSMLTCWLMYRVPLPE